MSNFDAFFAALLAASLSLPASSRAVEPQGETPASSPVRAIWKPQEIGFHYQSFTTLYTCRSLEAKVRRVLRALGAQPALRVRARGCMSTSDIARQPYVEIRLVSPVEATPKALAELEQTRSVRELAARVRGDSAQAAADEQPFPAQWQQVSFERRKLDLDPSDCELLEQLSRKVFPKLAVRVVSEDIRCVPNQIARTRPRLIVEALIPLPPPDQVGAP